MVLDNQKSAKALHERWSQGKFNYDQDRIDIIRIASSLLEIQINTKMELTELEKSLSIVLHEKKENF
ncbi:hypothetical protein RH08_02810 [Candidatus Liberibacter asiaticus]|uniref:Uncharacterized protein n=2 Tax=Liberibacter asiaticus TaxID=34021 RepID=C6XFG2_LIBAP|nr:hypothetical protein CLIBASIA_02645 [Candidatus Liberibacter asiaticus str. psy62]AGH16920.1 hypothetical protein WSI_02750 [Candidatus Liberibacter asiaticus str. gxpsy]ALK07263.1 hypothetical protein CD16_02775 [Candidatus Liberibacter asiaticus]BAP26441.1 hypothetical protein CGUJ_02645 [Candidatus Liberibacter asiaticus str. Ishi-1]ASK52751.1 hypothetical protein B2I23_02815 [Candidatus Liberibacter asiaticus]